MSHFTGGEKLEKYLAEMAKKVSSPGTLRVGFLENGTPEANGMPTATVAAMQEFGTSTIPPRPFFRNMIAAKSNSWGPALGTLLKTTDYDGAAALETMGQGIKEQLQDSINNTTEPPLSPITVMLRGMRSQRGRDGKITGAMVGEAAARVAAGKTNYGASTKPLVDTANMINSADFEVKKGVD